MMLEKWIVFYHILISTAETDDHDDLFLRQLCYFADFFIENNFMDEICAEWSVAYLNIISRGFYTHKYVKRKRQRV